MLSQTDEDTFDNTPSYELANYMGKDPKISNILYEYMIPEDSDIMELFDEKYTNISQNVDIYNCVSLAVHQYNHEFIYYLDKHIENAYDKYRDEIVADADTLQEALMQLAGHIGKDIFDDAFDTSDPDDEGVPDRFCSYWDAEEYQLFRDYAIEAWEKYKEYGEY